MTKKCWVELGRRQLQSVHLLHNHTLPVSVAERNTNAKLRQLAVTPGVVNILYRGGGYRPKQIYEILTKDCYLQGIPVQFTAKDIYNIVRKSSEKEAKRSGRKEIPTAVVLAKAVEPATDEQF